MALGVEDIDDVKTAILDDLKVSWAYANKQTQIQDAVTNKYQDDKRVEINLSIDSNIWSEFCQLYTGRYRSRKKHPKRPSYAKLRDDAIDVALWEYIDKQKRQQ